jgi:hypothetical protein
MKKQLTFLIIFVILIISFLFIKLNFKPIYIKTESVLPDNEKMYLFTGLGADEINEIIYSPIIKIQKKGYKPILSKEIKINNNKIYVKLKDNISNEILSSYLSIGKEKDWENQFKFLNIKGYEEYLNGKEDISGIKILSNNEIEFSVYNENDLLFLTIPNINTKYKLTKFSPEKEFEFKNGLKRINIQNINNKTNTKCIKYLSEKENQNDDVLYKYIGYIGIKENNDEKRNKLKNILLGNSENVDYINYISDGSFESVEIFTKINDICEKNNIVINQTFASPEYIKEEISKGKNYVFYYNGLETEIKNISRDNLELIPNPYHEYYKNQ